MQEEERSATHRRDFCKGTLALAVGALSVTAASATGRPLSDKEKLSRIASSCWPPRHLFRAPKEGEVNPNTQELRRKYGTITMLDFPQWTKDTYPGVYHMDLWSSVFGDPDDPDQFTEVKMEGGGGSRSFLEWDPSTPASRRWLDRMVEQMERTGTRCCHISNNAPRNLADPNEELRQEGVRVAKAWMDAASILGAKTMRANTGISGTRIMPEAKADKSGYPRNDEIVRYFNQCIKSFRELAEYGEKVDVIITIENHWGLCANPMNIRIIVEEVNHPYCEATPDFCNWEHEYHLFYGLEVLMPWTHHHVHAKYWDRWKTPEKDWNDVARSVQVLKAHDFRGTIALEYEEGPWDGIQGSLWLRDQVLAAL
ncbi:MAG TPA: sugar phosphate isomerase/epimerase family protein [Acidobacteriota bacterium]|jgi:sugar phosphate isomerase/epimerase|nr:sugar phosphate isomerase/epimerase family protein [Acidobacteriota bacterium]HRR25609.1 sugar phosphate isomerase/epimerase family protein [Acidobacteriota bacterium]HRR57030.1 sugar phosphate isomerase/epimerase family protein [Acidobacteriota bacterium]HRV08689.1 sugar phosphate isomerase/epimerase family protein [Acidobacteriota bacterium]